MRAYLGHERPDTRRQCTLLNEVYDALWLYYNFFQPVLHQQAKSYERPPWSDSWPPTSCPSGSGRS